MRGKIGVENLVKTRPRIEYLVKPRLAANGERDCGQRGERKLLVVIAAADDAAHRLRCDGAAAVLRGVKPAIGEAGVGGPAGVAAVPHAGHVRIVTRRDVAPCP